VSPLWGAGSPTQTFRLYYPKTFYSVVRRRRPLWIFFEVVLKVLAMVDAREFALGLVHKLLG